MNHLQTLCEGRELHFEKQSHLSQAEGSAGKSRCEYSIRLNSPLPGHMMPDFFEGEQAKSSQQHG